MRRFYQEDRSRIANAYEESIDRVGYVPAAFIPPMMRS